MVSIRKLIVTSTCILTSIANAGESSRDYSKNQIADALHTSTNVEQSIAYRLENLEMQTRELDPFGKNQDLTTKVVIEQVKIKPGRVKKPVTTVPLQNYLDKVRVNGVSVEQHYFIVGARKIKEGATIPLNNKHTIKIKEVTEEYVEVFDIKSKETGYIYIKSIKVNTN